MGAVVLVATALGLAVAPAAGGQAWSGSPAPDAQMPAATPPAATPPAAPVPGTLPRYRSPLEDYRPYRVDEPLLPWREANDAVGGLGGHMGHLERPAHGGGQ